MDSRSDTEAEAVATGYGDYNSFGVRYSIWSPEIRQGEDLPT